MTRDREVGDWEDGWIGRKGKRELESGGIFWGHLSVLNERDIIVKGTISKLRGGREGLKAEAKVWKGSKKG